MLLTTAGIVLVLLRGGDGSAWNPTLTPAQRLSGTLGAFIGALGQAGGTVIARPVLSQAHMEPLSAALVRMSAAAVALLLLALLRGQLSLLPRVWAHPVARRTALAGTVFGPVLGVWMSMVAIGRAQHTGVAAALMALMPIFMMPVARWLYGARIGALGAAGTVLAVAGAVWLLWRG
jgi:drug/metabolite transporter (DMT)-like permease